MLTDRAAWQLMNEWRSEVGLGPLSLSEFLAKYDVLGVIHGIMPKDRYKENADDDYHRIQCHKARKDADRKRLEEETRQSLPTDQLERILYSLPGRYHSDSQADAHAVDALLREGRELLSAEGWWHSGDKNAPGAWPFPDAIIAVYLRPFAGQVYDGDKRVLAEAMIRLGKVTGTAPHDLDSWGDDEARTISQVMDAFDAAIRNDEAAPAGNSD